MPVVGREGRSRRSAIREHFRIDPGKSIGLIYTGIFGLDEAAWADIGRFNEWEFLGIQPLPVRPPNYHIVDKRLFRYEDLSASVDCVISKLGYGVYAESRLGGVPLLFCPRTDFAEYPVLEASIMACGNGYRLGRDEFLDIRWGAALDWVRSGSHEPSQPNTGATLCARRIEEFARGGRESAGSPRNP